MRSSALLVALFVASAGTALGQASGPPVTPIPYAAQSLGDFQLSSISTATALSPPQNAVCATVVPEVAVRFTTSGTAPTASVGVLLQPYQPALFCLKGLASVQFIPTSGSGTISGTYFK